MSRKQYIGFIILAVVFLGAIFVWYSVRPTLIKQNCYDEATGKAKEKAKEERGITDGKFSKNDYDTYYKFCLQKNGL